MHSINPHTEETIAKHTCFSNEQSDTIITLNHQAFKNWRSTRFQERSELLYHLAKLLKDKKHDLAKLMNTEMGKALNEAQGEIDKCAWVCEYYAKNAQNFLADELIKTEYKESFVRYRPLGPVLAIMPWNFPFWQLFRFAAPALMAGNSIVMKHAENTFGCAKAIEKVFKDAGFPEALVSNLIIDVDQTQEVIKHPLIKAVTFTGSTHAGKSVAQTCGAHLKKCVLELGGNDAYIIMDDVNLEECTDICSQARLLNAGQSCISPKRFIVHKNIKKEFEQKLIEKFSQASVAPLARKDLQENLHRQVSESIKQGAQCLMGGELSKKKGYFYPPTILSDVTESMTAFKEELFGPVAVITEFSNLEEAITLANNSEYGLGAAVFSANIEKAKAIAINEIEAGSCTINDFVKSDPRLPFGGVKNSGIGRELSHFGIKEFTNIKTICVK